MMRSKDLAQGRSRSCMVQRRENRPRERREMEEAKVLNRPENLHRKKIMKALKIGRRMYQKRFAAVRKTLL